MPKKRPAPPPACSCAAQNGAAAAMPALASPAQKQKKRSKSASAGDVGGCPGPVGSSAATLGAHAAGVQPLGGGVTNAQASPAAPPITAPAAGMQVTTTITENWRSRHAVVPMRPTPRAGWGSPTTQPTRASPSEASWAGTSAQQNGCDGMGCHLPPAQRSTTPWSALTSSTEGCAGVGCADGTRTQQLQQPLSRAAGPLGYAQSSEGFGPRNAGNGADGLELPSRGSSRETLLPAPPAGMALSQQNSDNYQPPDVQVSREGRSLPRYLSPATDQSQADAAGAYRDHAGHSHSRQHGRGPNAVHATAPESAYGHQQYGPGAPYQSLSNNNTSGPPFPYHPGRHASGSPAHARAGSHSVDAILGGPHTHGRSQPPGAVAALSEGQGGGPYGGMSEPAQQAPDATPGGFSWPKTFASAWSEEHKVWMNLRAFDGHFIPVCSCMLMVRQECF